MKPMKYLLSGWLMFHGPVPCFLMGATVTAIPLSVEESVIDVEWSLCSADTAKQTKKPWRSYSWALDKEERKDITYIVDTLGYDDLVFSMSGKSILKKKSSLKEAGNRIKHVHPFRFLECVFKNEKLKAAIHAIRDRGGFVWRDFINGLTRSLDEENSRENLLPFVSDFAKTIKFSEERFLPLLKQKKWNKFVDLLIDEVPRTIDPNRYDDM
jgi:hypothetical protein